MAPYNTPQAIRPLEKTVCDFAYSNGYDPISVFNDFLRPDGLMYRFGGDSDRKTYL